MSTSFDLPLPLIHAGRERIAPYVRHTPLAPPPHLTTDLPSGFRLKLENLQVSGSFKARGVFNNLLLETPERCARGVVTASGGNHGLALAYAAHRLGLPARVYLPENATADRVDRVQSWGAECVRYGSAYDDAHREALRYATERDLIYVEAFDSEPTLVGQATLGLELLEDLPEMDAVFIAIGGGGLIGGMAAAIKQVKPSVTVIGIEPLGAASMQTALAQGQPVELETVRTIADTLAAKRTGALTLALAQRYVDDLVLVSDGDMIAGMKWLWRHYNQLVEPAAAAAIAAIQTGKIDLSRWQHPVALICGGNAAAEGVWHYYEDMARGRGTL
ncbi:MAG: threonine/serine dehydratase [Chloroflexota bacterium]|nr:threonine/serine dehydratase [Chloroflexota bacterium]